MAISPISASRCCSKYVLSRVPVADTDRWWDAMTGGGAVAVEWWLARRCRVCLEVLRRGLGRLAGLAAGGASCSHTQASAKTPSLMVCLPLKLPTTITRIFSRHIQVMASFASLIHSIEFHTPNDIHFVAREKAIEKRTTMIQPFVTRYSNDNHLRLSNPSWYTIHLLSFAIQTPNE